MAVAEEQRKGSLVSWSRAVLYKLKQVGIITPALLHQHLPTLNRSNITRDRAGILSSNMDLPGQRVFVDHFICSTRGRQFRGYGIRDPKSSTAKSLLESFSDGSIFVDAASGLIQLKL